MFALDEFVVILLPILLLLILIRFRLSWKLLTLFISAIYYLFVSLMFPLFPKCMSRLCFRFVSNVTRVSWLLVNNEPSYELSTDFQTPVKFHSDRHIRHHNSDKGSDTVQSYLWPALLSRSTCVHKAVVVTSMH